MARYIDANCRKCRKVNQKLYLKGERCLSPKCSLTRRAYPPGKRGAHGASRRLSDYGIQLMEKQKIRDSYNLLEKQFRSYYTKASKGDDAGSALLVLLEKRLDNVIKIAGIAPSTKAARQIVSHEKISVNGKKVKSPNFQLNIGDNISYSDVNITDNKYHADCPKWLARNDKNKTIEVKSLPTRDEINQDFKEDFVLELYSR